MDTTVRVVGEALHAMAERFPDHPFVKCGADYVAFVELDRRTDELAAGFGKMGLTKGDRVAILSPNRIEMLELYFALAKIGVVQVPLNTYLKGEFLRHQLADSTPTVLVVDHAGLLSAAELFGTAPALTTVVLLDHESESVAETLVSERGLTLRRYWDVAVPGATAPNVVLEESDCMSILYTSGTTGLPKGCILSHGYYLRVGRMMVRAHNITSLDTIFTVLPLFHSAARMMIVAAALVAGARLVVDPYFSARTFFRRAGEEHATLAHGIGAIGTALLESPPSEFDRAHSLRLATMSPMAADAQQAFFARFNVRVWAEVFGQTECVPITDNPLSEPLRRPGSSGRPVEDLQVVLLDDNDDPVPQGTAGEICLRPLKNNAMFSGYWGNPEATLKSYSHLWFHTGDMAYFDEDGFLFFVDRKKDAIRRKGENIASAELEAAITLHPSIVEVAVVAVPSASTEEDIKAVIVVVPGVQLEPRSIFEYFRRSLPYFAIPRYVEFLPELPRNAMGRVQKFKLKDHTPGADVWDFESLGFTVTVAERR